MKSKKSESKFSTSDILAFVSIIVSVFALFVCFKQLWLQEGQFDSQKKENQPIFDITTFFDKDEDDTNAYTEVLTIKSIGREALSIGLIQCETFIKFEERYYQDRQTLYIPVFDYFASHSDRPGLIGEVIADITEGNRKEYNRFSKECGDKCTRFDRYTCQLINFVIISYTDIYDDYHVVYYENGGKCSKEYYEDIVKKSRGDFGNKYFNMGLLCFDDLKEYCKIDKTRKMAR